MKRFVTLVALAATVLPLWGQPNTKGYYKDIFMDSGIKLTSRYDLPASRYLDLSMEDFVSTDHTDSTTALTMIDTMRQTMMMAGSPYDENGILLYPDGAPRFRVIYMNGGKAGSHGTSLGAQARDNIRAYIKAGGSYVGTCAGAYIASRGAVYSKNIDSTIFYTGYLGIFPGIVRGTALEQSQTDMTIEKGSPLLKYYDFGGDMHLKEVRHNGGCYLFTGRDLPAGTEILARYDTGDRKLERKIHAEASIWSYKKDDESGRVVSCGSHPEAICSGERLDLMCAMLKYAMEGNGNPKVKAALTSGECRNMTRFTHDGDPSHTGVGDLQYHHFTIEVPKGAESLVIRIVPVPGYSEANLYLFATPDEFAFKDNSSYKDVTLGAAKEIVINNPKKGTWYISVMGADTVGTVQTKWGTEYVSNLDVLNGIPYSIEATVSNK